MVIRRLISELLPAIFDFDPPSVQGNDPVILTSLLLTDKEVHILPAGEKIPPRRSGLGSIKLHPAFGGYGILKAVVDSDPKNYYKTLWAKSADVPIWIGSCDFERPFDDVLEACVTTSFGGVRVTKGRHEALITLGDAVELIKAGKLSTHSYVDEVSSAPIAISKDRPIIEAIKKMISHSVRRLFVDTSQGSYISDRTIMDYMFSPARLGIARDYPELWIDEPVAKLGTKMPNECISRSLDEAAKAIGFAPDDCLVTDGRRVVSRWDIVVKPWRAGKLEAVER